MTDERKERFAIERLNELKREMDREFPSESGRIAALAGFAKAHASRRHVWNRPAAWVAAAACAILAMLGAYWWRSPSLPQQPAAVRRSAPAPEVASSVPAPEPVVLPAPPVRTGRPQRSRGRVRAVPPAAPVPTVPPEVATDFFPLPYAPPLDPAEGAEVIRVRLPRSAMRSFGLPVSEDRWYERVPADVILGQDGVARAVRFVKLAQ